MDTENKRSRAILYTGAFRFPDGDAAAFRVYSIAQVLHDEGNTVAFAGWESGASHYEYNGHACYPQGEFRERQVGPVARLMGFLLRGARTLKWVRDNDRFDVVIAYNPPAIFALLLIVLGKLRGFSVALDTTEWYQSDHLPGGKYGLAAVENWLRMHLAYRFFNNVIAISSYLERKFGKRNVVRIPPLREPSGTAERTCAIGPVIKVLYAGDAGKKDKLLPFIAVVPLLAERLDRRVELHIAGIERSALDAVLDQAGVELAARMSIHCHGRVARAKVFDLYRECHFSILFREDARYAWAGFPTKAVESWSSGCPIITNAVGDLAAIAQHLVNAIVVDESQLRDQLVNAMAEIVENELFPVMVERSILTARQNFAPIVYRKAVADFVHKL